MQRPWGVRTRYLLPMELLLHALLGVIALLAIVPYGWIRRALEAQHWEHQWLLALGIVAMFGLTLAATEWLAGAHWSDSRTALSCKLRAWVALATVALGILIARAGALIPAPFLFGVGLLLAAFAAWSWWSNRRAWHLLCPECRTAALEERLQVGRVYL